MMTPLDRFVSKIGHSPEGCWLWGAYTMPNGYGKFPVSRSKNVLAHRWAYEAFIGRIPDGLCIDHLCRVRHCVNPLHMEPVTRRENVMRGEGLPAKGARQTHCTHGHVLDSVNTYYHTEARHRRCRICAKLYQRKLRSVRAAWHGKIG